MAAPLSPDSYLPFLNQSFTLHQNGASHGLTLTKVETLVDDVEHLGFSLLFQASQPLPQGNHRISHPQLGEFDLFLVPLRPTRSGPQLQAVFSLLKDEPQ